MDAHAHLIRLGWQGTGHALDSQPYKQKGHRGLAYDPSKVGNNGNGLVKPLLVSQRKTRLGIGKKAHEPASGNEWWLKGFQTALNNIGKSESERSSGTSTPIHKDISGYQGKHAGLYSYFVQGQLMQGTIREHSIQNPEKRKSDVLDDDSGNGLAVQSVTQLRSDAAFEDKEGLTTELDKYSKKKGKKSTRMSLEKSAEVGDVFEVESERLKKRKRKSITVRIVPDAITNTNSIQETKEQRRERRRKRKEKKAAKLLAQGNGEMHVADSQGSSEDSMARAARKAERKKIKLQRMANTPT